MEFLEKYWPLLVCVVLIIVAVVILIVFRDKPENNQNGEGLQDSTNNDQIVEEKPAQAEAEKEKDEVIAEENTDKAEESVEKKPNPKKTKTKKEKVEAAPVVNAQENEAEKPVEAETVEHDGEEKTVETKESTQDEKKTNQKYMVTYDKEHEEWVVKKTGASRASKRCKTKKEAMEVAEILAESKDMNIIVKKKDGKFQKRENAGK